jgi:hypothetical protein
MEVLALVQVPAVDCQSYRDLLALPHHVYKATLHRGRKKQVPVPLPTELLMESLSRTAQSGHSKVGLPSVNPGAAIY